MSTAVVEIARRWNLTEALATRRYGRECGLSVASMDRPQDMKAAALWYAARGFPVFPVHTVRAGECTCGSADCHSPGKHPRTKNGFKDATTESHVIASWWEKWPHANIGMPTGCASGIIAVDVDPRNGGPVDRASFVEQCGPLPETAEVETGSGGRHYYFKHTPGVRLLAKLGQGVDIKGDGGFVVCPPSLHKSGRRYAFDGLAGKAALLRLAEAPEWLLKDATAKQSPPQALDADIPEGQRNSTLTSLAGTMRRRRMGLDAVEAALLAENARRCKPPLPEAEVRRVAQSVCRYEPEGATPDSDRARPANEGPQVIMRCMADVEPEPVRWLFPGRIARGKVSLIAGDPGLGKSQITASLAAIVSTGGRWPTGSTNAERGSVIVLSAEDDPADTIRPRLEAAGADLTKVFILDAVSVGPFAGGGQRGFSLLRDLGALAEEAHRRGDLALVIVDPISAYLANVDSNNNAEVRGFLKLLADFASNSGVAVVCVSHLNKSSGSRALLRVTGSLGFVAAARAAFLVVQDRNIPERRLFLPLKNNIGNDTLGMAFRIESATIASDAGPIETSRVIWEEKPVTDKADDVVASNDNLGERSAIEAAKDFLQQALAEGPMPAAEVQREATAEGISKATLRRAGTALGIQKGKQGMSEGWVWSLPTKMLNGTEDAHPGPLNTFGEIEHLRSEIEGSRDGAQR